MARRVPPKAFSAYLVIASSVPEKPKGSVLLDKGNLLLRDWTFMNFETGVETVIVGKRIMRICAICKVKHKQVSILDHEAAHGSEEAKAEGLKMINEKALEVADSVA